MYNPHFKYPKSPMYFFKIYVKKCVKLCEKWCVHKKKWSAGKHFGGNTQTTLHASHALAIYYPLNINLISF